MGQNFFDLTFTPSVKAEQQKFGSRAAYARVEGRGPGDIALSAQEAAFIAARDSFYLASVSETGWPYVQHRGGPARFVQAIDETTLAWAELIGNRQYLSAGNTAVNDRVALIMVDYPARQRLKLLGHMSMLDPSVQPELLARLTVADGAKIERVAIVKVAAFDWNCPQHITPRYTLAELQELDAGL